MKYLILIGALLAANASATCTINSTTDGAISVFSTFIFPSSSGQYVITNDSPGTHTVTIPAITELVSPVQGVDISGNLTLNLSVTSGPNVGATFGGSDSTARVLTLANSGTDTISISVQGSLDAQAKAGTYTVDAALSCI